MIRNCGILYPVFSLPSKYGIGCFSQEAYDFVDFLDEAGQGYWQILPLGPTGFGDSPYQPVSAFAGNPYFIDLETLTREGLLEQEEYDQIDWGADLEKVDYGRLYNERENVLLKAYARFKENGGLSDLVFLKFRKDEGYWLNDYSLYRLFKTANNGKSWQDWPEKIKKRDEETLKQAEKENADQLSFYAFEQFKFSEQWNALKSYAEEKNIQIIGDIPFYVSLDSADCWAHPEVFRMDEELKPAYVAGCAPDAFSATGQLWGNPVYDWDSLKTKQYDWWIQRIRRNHELYDVLRIDHFEGFSSYYAVPYGEKTAENGTSFKGPGRDLFDEIYRQLGKVEMIAEDLGQVTEDTKQLLKDTGIPGMNLLQYAFTSWNSIYLPYKHEKKSVVYTETHDNAPVREWLDEINDGTRDFVRRYLNSMNTDYGALTWDFIREAYRSPADLCIIPIQDYLVKGQESRLNVPGTSQGNWQWRVLPDFLSDDLALSIKQLAATYGRLVTKD